MSLLTKASLVLTPNAIKSNKVYSIIPSNGNGDLTFTRDTAATQINSLGNVENVLTTIPRLNYDSVGGCPSLLLEPQRTNLLSYSEDFSFTSWIKKGLTTITANTTTSPDGTIDADTLNNASGSLVWDSGNTLQRDITLVSTSTTYTFSVYVKSLGSTTFSIALRNQSTGASVSSNIVPNSGWQRVTVTQTTTVNTSIGLLFGNTNGNVAIWGVQLEQGAYATSYIPTTTAAVTRNADTFLRNNIYTNGLITSAGGTWFIELNNNVAYIRDNAGTGLYLGDSATTPSNSIGIINTGTGRLVINKRISGSVTSLYTTLTNTVKIAFKWNGVTMDVFVNGTKQVTGEVYTTKIMEFLSAYQCYVPKSIKSMLLFPTPLTDTEMINLTTL